MGNPQDILDEIMSDLGMSDELARSIRQTEEKAKETSGEYKRPAEQITAPVPITHVKSAVARNSASSGTKKGSSNRNVSQNSSRGRSRANVSSGRKAVGKSTVKSAVKPASKGKKNKSTINKFNISIHVFANVVFYTIAIVLILKVAGMAFDFAYQIYGSDPVDEKPGKFIAIDIDKGTSSFEVAKQLELNNLIKDKYSFLLRLKLSEKEIYASSYTLSTAMDYDEIIKTICDYSKAEEENNNSKKK